MSQSVASADYPALKVITQEIALRDFASTLTITGLNVLDILVVLGVSPIDIKIALLRAYNPGITETLTLNSDVVYPPELIGERATVSMVSTRLRSLNDGFIELSQNTDTYTLLLFNPMSVKCIEQVIGADFGDLQPYNRGLGAVEDGIIPAPSVLFVPQSLIESHPAADAALPDCAVSE
ncbi:MAG: hypothetical protein R3A44_27005 [Caldilineaceae bacterium]